MTRYGEQLIKIGEYGDGSPKFITRRHYVKFRVVGKKLGYDLTVIQGCSHPGVGVSGGTHDLKDVADLAPFEWEKKCRHLRMMADTAFHRLPIPGVWEEHIHTNDIGGKDTSAGWQVDDYIDGKDGLSDHGPDRQWRPNPLRLRWSIGMATLHSHLPRAEWPRVDLSKVIARAEDGGHRRNPGVRVIQRALNQELGLGLTVDGHYGPSTKAAYAKWQRKIAIHDDHAPVDGIPNERTLSRLGLRRALRFIVTK